MKKPQIISALLLSSMILIPNTTVFAATNTSNTNAKSQVVQKKQDVKLEKNIKPLPVNKFTYYTWRTTTYTSPYKWYKVNGPSGNNGNFKLKNRRSHYSSLHLSWTSNVVPKDMKIEIYNNDTGGRVTHNVSGRNSGTTFTDLVRGNYTVYVQTGNWNTLNFYVEDGDLVQDN